MNNFHVIQYFEHLAIEASINGKDFYADSMHSWACRENSDAIFFEANGALELPNEISF